MQTFAYVALEPSGRRKTGVLEAANVDAAIATLSSDGGFILEIKEAKSIAESGPQIGSKKATRADLALFTRRLADLSAAGLPLDRVLQVVSEQSESEQLRDIALQALEDVRSGKPVSDALAAFPKQFAPVFTQTLRAGEASGQFPEVAGRLADFQEKEVNRRSQITSALIYPAVLSVVAIFVVTFLITFVVPKLTGVFADLHGDLPGSTKALLAMTDFVTKDGLYVLAALIAAYLAYRAFVATEAGALARDRAVLQAPILGSVIRKATISRFARVLATLVYGGVPILESLRLAGLASGNLVFQVSSNNVEHDVREGKPIAEAMRDEGGFPPILTHMVAIGEETGDLPKMLNRVSDSLDFEVDNGLRRLTALVEPLIVILMGVFVGFVVLSVLLPIFQAQELVK